MSVLLGMIVFFSFISLIAVIPLLIYSKKKKDFKTYDEGGMLAEMGDKSFIIDRLKYR